MILLLDIGNTHTHLGLANGERVLRQKNIPTAAVLKGAADDLVAGFVGGAADIALFHAGIVESTVGIFDEVEHVEPSGSETVGRDYRACKPNGRLECALQPKEDRVHALLRAGGVPHHPTLTAPAQTGAKS